MKKISLITIEMQDGTTIDIQDGVHKTESDYYTSFSKLKRIKQYIKANNIKTPINSEVFNSLIKMKMIRKRR